MEDTPTGKPAAFVPPTAPAGFSLAEPADLQRCLIRVYGPRVPEVDEEEDDKAAELEALLEQFREPEEPPRRKNGVADTS